MPELCDPLRPESLPNLPAIVLEPGIHHPQYFRLEPLKLLDHKTLQRILMVFQIPYDGGFLIDELILNPLEFPLAFPFTVEEVRTPGFLAGEFLNIGRCGGD